MRVGTGDGPVGRLSTATKTITEGNYMTQARDASARWWFEMERKCKKYDSFCEASGQRDVWLCDASVQMHMIKRVIEAMGPRTDGEKLKIFVPGIARSTIGYKLLELGFDVTIADLDAGKLSDKNKTFEDAHVGYAHVEFFDLLQPLPDHLKGKFDLVIESSVVDVFMQEMTTHKAKRRKGVYQNATTAVYQDASTAFQNIISTMNQTGVCLTFSMNCEPWDNILLKPRETFGHLSCMNMLPRITYCKSFGRTCVDRWSNSVLVFTLSSVEVTMP